MIGFDYEACKRDDKDDKLLISITRGEVGGSVVVVPGLRSSQNDAPS